VEEFRLVVFERNILGRINGRYVNIKTGELRERNNEELNKLFKRPDTYYKKIAKRLERTQEYLVSTTMEE